MALKKRKISIIASLLILANISLIECNKKNTDISASDTPDIPKVKKESVTLSFARDVTMGNYIGSTGEATFDGEFKKQSGDESYFFKNVKSIFEKIEGTLEEVIFREYNGRYNLFTRNRYYGVYSYQDESGNTKLIESISYNLSENVVSERTTIYYNEELDEAIVKPNAFWSIYHCSLTISCIILSIFYLLRK